MKVLLLQSRFLKQYFFIGEVFEQGNANWISQVTSVIEKNFKTFHISTKLTAIKESQRKQ